MKFIQILSWIIVPVLFGAILVTIFMHYRKKRKNSKTDHQTDEDFIHASPEQVGYTNGDGEYILFDHSSLIQEYKDRLSYHHARYSALQHDFDKMETKYDTLINYASFSFDSTINNKKNNMENLNASATSLQPHAEQGYLKDMLAEKSAQIEFLQSQLELRIRQQHQAEQQRTDTIAEKENMKGQIHDLDEQIGSLRNELLMRQEDADKMQMLVCQKEEKISEQQHLVSSKLDHITYLENILHETKEQHEISHATAADQRDHVLALQQQLSDEQSRVQYLEQKLLTSKQAMKRLYKEFSGFMETENEPSPVINLRPDYITSEETAAQ